MRRTTPPPFFCLTPTSSHLKAVVTPGSGRVWCVSLSLSRATCLSVWWGVQAFEFLEAEIFPLFLRNDGPKGYRYVNKRIRTAFKIRQQPPDSSYSDVLAVSAASFLPTPQPPYRRPTADRHKTQQHPARLTHGCLSVWSCVQALTQELRSTLSESVAAKALMDFMVRQERAEVVLFYLEILDFQQVRGQVAHRNHPPTAGWGPTGGPGCLIKRAACLPVPVRLVTD